MFDVQLLYTDGVILYCLQMFLFKPNGPSCICKTMATVTFFIEYTVYKLYFILLESSVVFAFVSRFVWTSVITMLVLEIIVSSILLAVPI